MGEVETLVVDKVTGQIAFIADDAAWTADHADGLRKIADDVSQIVWPAAGR
jgi:hypothetical protein